MGQNVIQITPAPDARKDAEKIMSLLRAGQKWSGEFLVQRRDGKTFHAAVTNSPLYDEKGELVGIVGISSDISEQKRMQEELIKAKNLESIGLLAGGIAHDFNNILTALLGNIALAKMYAKAGDQVFESLSEAEKAFWRARDLTQQLLTFSKGGAPIKKTGSVAEVLKDTVGFVLSGSNVSCEWGLPEDLWPVKFDPGQISQVANNLVLNAKQAMPEGGTIKLSGENVILRENQIVSLRPGRYIKLSITDRGIGIPKQHLSKIFDPYFTTKQQGSGLGLATVYSIIKRHEGGIHVDSTVGAGTTFAIYLPASDELYVAKKEEIGVLPPGQGKILLMDDEVTIRNVMGELLTELGYQMSFAKDGAELLEIYRDAMQRQRPFDAVIMDLTIPGGMGGAECIRLLKEIDPEAKAIVSSGYSNDPMMAEFRKYGFCGVISKPYQLKELSETLYKTVMKTRRENTLIC
jgi:signal transduction histidine kinase/ActR/RegA family two-component response regulator